MSLLQGIWFVKRTICLLVPFKLIRLCCNIEWTIWGLFTYLSFGFINKLLNSMNCRISIDLEPIIFVFLHLSFFSAFRCAFRCLQKTWAETHEHSISRQAILQSFQFWENKLFGFKRKKGAFARVYQKEKPDEYNSVNIWKAINIHNVRPSLHSNAPVDF